jgi:pimeloyl-ACP methyl ester carboxylesterase
LHSIIEAPDRATSLPSLTRLLSSHAAVVLDAVGVPNAHVFGVSMGGMIAQEFALQYPERVQSLILGCTAAGGPNAKRAEPAAIEMLKSQQPDEPGTSSRGRDPL